MTYTLHFPETSLIGESRQCRFTDECEHVQQTESADTSQKEAQTSPEVRAKSLHADVQHNTDEEVGKATNGVRSLQEAIAETDKQLAALRHPIHLKRLPPDKIAELEQITSSLAPEQQRVIRGGIGAASDTHQEALVTFVQKLTPGMCERLPDIPPLSPDDMEQFGKILPTLNRQEMD